MREEGTDVDTIQTQGCYAIKGHAIDELQVRGFHPLQVAGEIEVLRVDIGDNNNSRGEQQKSAVALISLGHQKATLAQPGVRAQHIEFAANYHGRIEVG